MKKYSYLFNYNTLVDGSGCFNYYSKYIEKDTFPVKTVCLQYDDKEWYSDNEEYGIMGQYHLDLRENIFDLTRLGSARI